MSRRLWRMRSIYVNGCPVAECPHCGRRFNWNVELGPLGWRTHENKANEYAT